MEIVRGIRWRSLHVDAIMYGGDLLSLYVAVAKKQVRTWQTFGTVQTIF